MLTRESTDNAKMPLELGVLVRNRYLHFLCSKLP